MLISPAEPLTLRRIGTVSPIPERYGCDFLWVAHGEKVGVQRKTASDFVGSTVDGRLHREVLQMQQLGPVRALLLEGAFVWSTDGAWMGAGFRWDKGRHTQAMFSLFAMGIMVFPTESIADTIMTIGELERWTQKGSHSFARNRAKAAGQWGTPSSREFGSHMLQSLPGCGPTVAEAIFDYFGGVPWRWTVTEKELKEVPGVGKVRARSMLAALPAIDPIPPNGSGGPT